MHPARLPPSAKRVHHNRVWASFDYAFRAFSTRRARSGNMRIHLVAAALALFASLYLRLERAYVAIVVLCIALVIALELVNTAIEAVVDLMTVAHHPLAKIAKDAAAGAVLVAFDGARSSSGTSSSTKASRRPVPRSRSAVAGYPAQLRLRGARRRRRRDDLREGLGGRAGHGTPLQGGAVSGHAALAFAGRDAHHAARADPRRRPARYFLAFW
jgi:diacylglycerol kinase